MLDFRSLGVPGILACAIALACGGESDPTGGSGGATESGTSGGESSGATGEDGGTATSSTGDAGDGDSTGDGDAGDGDSAGDGDVNCRVLEREACSAEPQCQPLTGQPIMRTMDGTGGSMLCALPVEFIACIPTMGCGDVPTLWCNGMEMLLTPDDCGPPEWDACVDTPPGAIPECP